MKNRIVNLIFPLLLFVLLCVAVIAVGTAPRMAGSADAGHAETERATPADPDAALPDTPPSPPETEAAPPAETDPEPALPTDPEPAAEAEPTPEPEPEGEEEPLVIVIETEAEPELPPDGEPDAENKDPGEPADEPEQGGQELEEAALPFDVHPFDGSEEAPGDTDENAGGEPADGEEPEPAETPAPGSVSASLDAFSPEVRAMIASMSDRELLTQMFIATYDGSWATAGYAADYGFGGYITFAEDYENDTPESFREGVDRVTASSKIPPLYAVDEEGGTVTRASKYPGYRRFPFLSPREVYEGGGIDGIRSDAAEKAELLKKLGLNYNLAPVADISVNSWDYMYNRSPGQDAETTSDIVTTIVQVFNQRGVASTVKHFPGYGAVSDTHTAMAWDGRTVEELENFDLIPFRRAMEAGVPSVMVSHIITALDPERPASVSAKVVDYIRANMGYDGVLITDDMRMNGILDFCTSGNGSLEAILAGYDLICCTNWPEQFPVVWEAVENGSLTRERLELSAARVLRMKQDLGIWAP